MEKQVFVARERELVQLDGFLKRALAAQGLVCFVTGEAGSGKTALITEFARRAQEQYADLAVAVGQGDAQTGAGDAHLPFREVLGQLTGDVEAKLAQGAITQENAKRLRKLLVLSGQALVEVGPDLIGVFVPGAGLVARVGTLAAEKVGLLDKLERLVGKQREGTGPVDSGIQQSHIFEQYANVLCKLSEKNPLLLFLDDLQWADTASIGLLFRLGRRIGKHRILLVGTYRPEEVAIGRAGERHPLEKVLAEFKRYFGKIWVDLEWDEQVEGQYFVNAFLNTEPNKFEQGFRQKLFHHTGGHALFTIELLRTMQERGDLIRDEQGRWVETPVLDWESLPKRVEGVIEERIGRLEEDLRQMLTIGSVQGEDFTAEVVARVQTAETRGLIQRLSGELERQHRLVSARGVRRLEPAGQRLSLYRFQHNLFQKYLYNELGEAERAYLHEDVGNALEELYGNKVDEIVVQLARHFDEAGVVEKSIKYLKLAGEQAAIRYANEDAVAYISRALALVQQDDLVRRYDLLKAREKVRNIQGDYQAQKEDLSQLLEIAETLDDKKRQAEVALHQMIYLYDTNDFSGTMEMSERALDLAKAARDLEIEASINLRSGMSLWQQGQNKLAYSKIECALALALDNQFHQLEADSLRQLGNVYSSLGDLAQGQSFGEQALAKYREIGDRGGESTALNNLGVNYSMYCGDFDRSIGCFEQFLQISREIGDRKSEALALNNLGMIAFWSFDFDRAINLLLETLDIYHEVGNTGDEGRTYKELGYCHLSIGEYEQARAYYDRALELTYEVGDLLEEISTLIQCIEYYFVLGDFERSESCYEKVIPKCGDIDDQETDIWKLIALGLLRHYTGDNQAAREHIRQALHIMGDQRHILRWKGLTILGHSLTALGELAEAEDVYHQAISLGYETNRPRQSIEALAGLAQVSMARGDTEQALSQVEQILTYLETGTPSKGHPLDGTIEPVRIYLTCYQVLKANNDNRAHDILDEAHNLLQKRAATISDEELRHSFLENMAENREFVAEFARSQLPQ